MAVPSGYPQSTLRSASFAAARLLPFRIFCVAFLVFCFIHVQFPPGRRVLGPPPCISQALSRTRSGPDQRNPPGVGGDDCVWHPVSICFILGSSLSQKRAASGSAVAPVPGSSGTSLPHPPSSTCNPGRGGIPAPLPRRPSRTSHTILFALAHRRRCVLYQGIRLSSYRRSEPDRAERLALVGSVPLYPLIPLASCTAPPPLVVCSCSSPASVPLLLLC